jgi:hypothetical protein
VSFRSPFVVTGSFAIANLFIGSLPLDSPWWFARDIVDDVVDAAGRCWDDASEQVYVEQAASFGMVAPSCSS